MKVLVLCILLAATVGCIDQPAHEPTQVEQSLTDTDIALSELELAITRYETDAQQSGSWLPENSLVGLYLSRARLTGGVEDYVKAGVAIDRAFEKAADGTGPFLTRASYKFAIHEVRAVAPDVDRFAERIYLKKDEQAEVEALRGDVAFHTSDLETALLHFVESERLHPTMASAARLGHFALKTGDIDQSRHWYDLAIERTSDDPYQTAWATLHRGIVELESGSVDEARRFFERANDVFAGWYLVEEHLAEVTMLHGDYDDAVTRYQHVLERVPNGEFYAALADTYDAMSEPELAQRQRELAHRAFERDLSLLESAANGHALDFYLDYDPRRAEVLATKNFETRPSFEARVKLTQAKLRNGKREEAREVLRPMLDSRWATPDFFALRDELF